MKSKFLSFFAAVTLSASGLSGMLQAAVGPTSVTAKGNVTTTFEIDDDGTLTFSGHFFWWNEFGKYTDLNNEMQDLPWLSYSDQVKKVVFSEANGPIVFSKMFYNFSNLESVDFSNLNYPNTIDNVNFSFAFEGCSSLKSVSFPAINAKTCNGFTNVFSGCTNVENIDMSQIKVESTKGAIWFANVFKDCSALTDVKLPTFSNNSSIVCFDRMFYGCTNLTSIDMSQFTAEDVTTMASMFENCKALKHVDISNIHAAKVTNMLSMFKSCGLETIDLSNFTTDSLKTCEGMFNSCLSLKSINVRGFNTSNVTSMKGMFAWVNKVCSIYLPSAFLHGTYNNLFNNLTATYNLYIPDGENFESEKAAYEALKIGDNTIIVNAGYATAIQNVLVEQSANNDVWYNIVGQKVDSPKVGGLYIKAGKKVIFK